MDTQSEMKLFTLNSNEPLAQEISEILEVPLGKSSVVRFSDGEMQVNIEESVRGDDIYLVQSTSQPVNEHVMELLIMVDALKRASAKTINVVIPYYGYARQDRKARPREPITAKLLANLLEKAGVSRVITLDLHAPQIQGFFNIPVDQLLGIPILGEHFKSKEIDDLVVVAPNTNGLNRVRKMANILDAPLAFIDKRQPEPNMPEVRNVVGAVEGKNVIIVDDMMDTADTVTVAAEILYENGVHDIYACGTHAVFSDPAVIKVEQSPIKELVITNSIFQPEEKRLEKITTLSVAPLLADALLRVQHEHSVSVLFD
ncbi:ribose-phosphate pyrophosphokinase [Halobacillus karajensis]|uniref:Ribose-phosphate pyrophosphokinase n=1 Tax=Halobacillus karajensis TaxID=195088 RepID=A0A024P5U1_9BACI|nr:ribose-phosphate pyrophosphokinase [Halobacillus karajensis]CDQ17824.1 Ribose-phosphate pyrophosphokinase [Halobacillus karajensis]CDQ24230.1 Ribose-phosphate pyrophosphokinase [Halobacillus karajensis]CDQ29521.1 Ribose-phosphate pyrophosphokinase [Halobacillus karajensis]SEH63198.1 ribose-phosphate pyrophosphokinase [Halobacillus karajensis]